jgi:Putative zinc ribbon domain
VDSWAVWTIESGSVHAGEEYFDRLSQVLDMKLNKPFKNCQSCGMPLKRDEGGGGTNVDGSRSGMYCSHCYKSGEFTVPDITATQMQERVKGKMKEMGFPGFMTGLFTRGIPKLERWKRKS